MYRFALRPRWVAGHVLIVGLVVVFVALGGWQLRRLEERRAHNETLGERTRTVVALPPEGFGDDADTGRLAYQRVRAVGRYEPGGEVLVGYRSHQGLPGYHVLTPFRTAGGVVMVQRGWVPVTVGERWPVAEATPPAGEVEISGVLVPSEGAGRFRLRQPAPGGPLTVGAVHLPGLERHLDQPLYGLALQLEAAGSASLPVAVPVPRFDEGKHLSYAIQWFLFAAGAAAGWLVLVRKSANERRRQNGAGADASTPGQTSGVPEGAAVS